MQLGEAISTNEFLADEHDEATCPWHDPGPTDAAPMPATDPDVGPSTADGEECRQRTRHLAGSPRK